VQGTLYPDVIESRSVRGPSQVIKTHHNVGGLPEKMKLKLIEPLKDLFKDECGGSGATSECRGDPATPAISGPRSSGADSGRSHEERADMLRECDEIVVGEIKKAGLYQKICSPFAVLLPVDVSGSDGRSADLRLHCAVRAVHSEDGMTARLGAAAIRGAEDDFQSDCDEVRGVNRVVYDITSKPPGTIEWE